MDDLSAAHTTLPLPSYAKVTNLANRREIIVRVNDRGPFVDDRIIDLSRKSADALGFRRNGTAPVRVQYIGPAPLEDEGGHLAAMNEELRRGTPLHRMISAARGGGSQRQPEVALAAAIPQASQERALASTNGAYFIQVGAFANRGNAERARSRLSDLGSVHVTPVNSGFKTLYRVTLGPIGMRSAEQALAEVQAHGHSDARLTTVRN
jgi:rare lipoprotein A